MLHGTEGGAQSPGRPLAAPPSRPPHPAALRRGTAPGQVPPPPLHRQTPVSATPGHLGCAPHLTEQQHEGSSLALRKNEYSLSRGARPYPDVLLGNQVQYSRLSVANTAQEAIIVSSHTLAWQCWHRH